MSLASIEAALDRGEVFQCLLVEIEHPDGTGYFWSGTGMLEYGGNTYAGAGALGSVSEIVSSTETEVTEYSFNLAGVDPDIVEDLDDTVKGRAGRVYEAFLDRHFRVVETDLLVEAALDYQVFGVDEQGKTSIAIKAHGGLFFLGKRSAAKISPEEARALDPDETGFDRVHQQEDIVATWKAS
jgi:hypothetical protein